jgi:hypothetical protein
MSFVLKLKKPIDTASGSISQITFRDPNGDDIFSLGLPFRTIMSGGDDGQGEKRSVEMVMDGKNFKKWCIRLADTGEENLIAVPANKLRTVFEWLAVELNPDGEPGDQEKN